MRRAKVPVRAMRPRGTGTRQSARGSAAGRGLPHSACFTVHISSASQATLSSTVANALNFQMPRI